VDIIQLYQSLKAPSYMDMGAFPLPCAYPPRALACVYGLTYLLRASRCILVVNQNWQRKSVIYAIFVKNSFFLILISEFQELMVLEG